jgi:hypothetical protein
LQVRGKASFPVVPPPNIQHVKISFDTMAIALLTGTLMGIVGIVITVYMGFSIDGRLGVSDHFMFALFATMVVTLSHSMAIFYFIGTGKQVKDLLESHPQAGEFIQRTRVFKSQTSPSATMAILFTMAAWIIGGGVDTRVVPTWIHTVLALLALITNVVAFVREAKCMAENNILLDEVAVLVGETPQGE